MTIAPGLASELRLLAQAQDLPGPDIVDTLTGLISDARAAVDSYLGLSVEIATPGSPFHLTVLSTGTRPEDIRTSLLVPLRTPGAQQGAAAVAVVLYAAAPGAFVDLAADLSWITGRPVAEFRLDDHRPPDAHDTASTGVQTAASVNQALGVLVGRGATPEQAEHELHDRAKHAGVDLLGAATLLLAALSPSDCDRGVP